MRSPASVDWSLPQICKNSTRSFTELHGLPANSILYKSSKRDTVTLGGKPEPRFRVFMEVSPEGEVYLASKGYFLQTLTSPVKVNLLQRHRDDN